MNHKCNRCGLCCDNIGATFFVHSDHPLIKAIMGIDGFDYCFTDTGQCAMLAYEEENGVQVAVCLIHKYLGEDAKPDACREYPSKEILEQGEQFCGAKQ